MSKRNWSGVFPEVVEQFVEVAAAPELTEIREQLIAYGYADGTTHDEVPQPDGSFATGALIPKGRVIARIDERLAEFAADGASPPRLPSDRDREREPSLVNAVNGHGDERSLLALDDILARRGWADTDRCRVAVHERLAAVKGA